MRVHVVYAHPLEQSFNHALYAAAVETLSSKGHEIDALDLYADGFDAVLSREERINYHEVPGNITPAIASYVARLRAADAIVFVHPVWNYGYPAILKGYFDRIFLPGVSFVLKGGGDRGDVRPCLDNIRKVAFITSYGGNRLRTMLMGDPPRRLARRWAWATFRTRTPPLYLALYDMNNATAEIRSAFLARVREKLSTF